MLYMIPAFSLLLVVLAIGGWTDAREGKVYNWLTYPAIVLGLVYWTAAGLAGAVTLDGEPVGLTAAVIALGAALLPMLALRLAGGIGGGDVKLMGAVGAISASWECVLSTAVYALLIGVVLGLGMMVRRGRTKRTLANLFGVALTAASGTKPEVGDEQSPQVPFSLAIAIGGLVAGAEQMLGLQTPWVWLAP